MVVHSCNPSYSGGWGRRITWTREAEVAVSWDRSTALQPWTEWDSISKKEKKKWKKKRQSILSPYTCTCKLATNIAVIFLKFLWGQDLCLSCLSLFCNMAHSMSMCSFKWMNEQKTWKSKELPVSILVIMSSPRGPSFFHPVATFI